MSFDTLHVLSKTIYLFSAHHMGYITIIISIDNTYCSREHFKLLINKSLYFCLLANLKCIVQYYFYYVNT